MSPLNLSNFDNERTSTFQKIWKNLVEPTKSVIGSDNRNKARLLTTYIIIAIIFFLTTIFLYLTTYQQPYPTILKFSFLFLFILYLLSRTVWWSYTARLFIGLIPVIVFSTIITDVATTPLIVLDFLLLDIIIAVSLLPFIFRIANA